MKKFILSVLITSTVHLSYSQNITVDLSKGPICKMDFSSQLESIDTMRIYAMYSYKHIEAPQYNMSYRQDSLCLEIGNAVAHSYAIAEKKWDEKNEEYFQTLGKRKMITYSYRIGEVYTNLGEGEMTVLTALDIAGVYLYKENIPDFWWVISNDHKTILEYDCIKATCSFRGRDYEAWFTQAIPIRSGPWKFGGLPGLILEIRDSKSEYIFECKNIQKVQNAQIKFWNREYKKCTRNEIRKNQYLLHKKPADFYNYFGHQVRTIKGPITNEEWGFEPNPIEKE